MPDFASLMAAQMKKTQSTGRDASADSKYIKKSDIEAQRQAAYVAEQERKVAARLDREDKKRKADDEERERNEEREAKRRRMAEQRREEQQEEDSRLERERRKRIGLPELPLEEEREIAEEEDSGEEDDDVHLPHVEDSEITIQLRRMGQPVKLFGETHKQRSRRYHAIRAGGTSSTASKSKGKQPITTTLQPVDEADCKISKNLPSATDRAGRKFLARQLATWFNLVLREWAVALLSRDDATKQTFAGQAASNSFAQALEHLRPLFRRLEKLHKQPADLPDDLLKPIAEIVEHAQERRYVKANDGYLQLSIGKAAWPIGVTMVGIHERSAREKLHESDQGKAHIMSDESTRKFLQSIKRCLSFAQTRWPPADAGQLMG